MKRALGLALLVALLVGGGSVAPARAAAQRVTAGACQSGKIDATGALWEICVPSGGWNGDLFIYAHGYVAPGDPLAIQDRLPDGSSIPTIAQALGYAFATTSYRQNGLAILPGVDDLRDLIAVFPSVAGQAPKHVYVLGASEGSLITTLLVERHPQLVSGAVAACGPIGDFQAQLDYIGDFRAAFDRIFPGALPPSAVDIPPSVTGGWTSTYTPAISAALASAPISATQLISATSAAIDPALPTTRISTTLDVLWYNVFATNDAKLRLGGNPYGRNGYQADPAALAAVAPYQTSGKLTRPLIVLHTDGDPIIPYAQATQYAARAQPSGRGRFTLTKIPRYGHCTFNLLETQSAFNQLVAQVAASEQIVELRQLYVPLVGRA